MKGAIYNLKTGYIDRVVHSTTEEILKLQIADEALEGLLIIKEDIHITSTSHYVSKETLELVEKEPLEYTTEINGLSVIIKGLPEGLNVYVYNNYQLIGETLTDNDQLELEFDKVSTYKIRLNGLVQYKDEELELKIDG